MTQPARNVSNIGLVGGEPALDFVNTASKRQHGPLEERLQEYGDLLVWAERAGLLTAKESRALRGASKLRSVEASAVLARAREFRESLYRLFTARSRGERATPADLERLSLELSAAASARRLVDAEGDIVYAWPAKRPLQSVLWPVAVSAADLLTEGDWERVKECGGENCNWLFYDASKNRSRRWCEMKDCGNRAKARRYHARHRGGAG